MDFLYLLSFPVALAFIIRCDSRKIKPAGFRPSFRLY